MTHRIWPILFAFTCDWRETIECISQSILTFSYLIVLCLFLLLNMINKLIILVLIIQQSSGRLLIPVSKIHLFKTKKIYMRMNHSKQEIYLYHRLISRLIYLWPAVLTCKRVGDVPNLYRMFDCLLFYYWIKEYNIEQKK